MKIVSTAEKAFSCELLILIKVPFSYCFSLLFKLMQSLKVKWWKVFADE